MRVKICENGRRVECMVMDEDSEEMMDDDKSGAHD